jgi:regulator of ribosome biosynthesis
MAPKLDIQVSKPTPYNFDLGLLLANDPNPLPPSDESTTLEERLSSVARDGAQSLINQLLTTVPLESTQAGVLLTLPQPTTPLPREKPLPAVKEQTKWEKFAQRKGIKPKTREQRREKGRKFNERTGEYEKTWGYDKGGAVSAKKNGLVPDDWVVEVDGKAEREAKASKAGLKNKKRKV